MNKLLFSLVAIVGFAFSSIAQTKSLQTVKINTPTVQCGTCKNKIETYLKRYNGITSVNVNYKKKETTVKYVTDRINEEEIKAAIATKEKSSLFIKITDLYEFKKAHSS